MPFKSVIVKGLGKIKFPSTMSDDAIAQSIKGLDMSEAARTGRAKEQGFEGGYYRGLSQPYEEGIARPVTWTTKDKNYVNIYAEDSIDSNSSFSGQNIMPLSVKVQNPFDFGYRDLHVDVKKSDVLDRIKHKVLDDESIDDKTAEKVYRKIKNMQKESGSEYKKVYQWIDEDPDIAEVLKQSGFDSIAAREYERNIVVNKPKVETVGLLNPQNIRSKHAAFNPDLKDSTNLLASAPPFAVGPIAGLSALSSQESKADTGTIEGPKHPKIAGVSSFIDKRDDIIMDDMLGGLTSYMNKLAYDDKITMKDRVLMALDLL